MDTVLQVGVFEETKKVANDASDRLDGELRDLAKKVQKMEANLEETTEALQASYS